MTWTWHHRKTWWVLKNIEHPLHKIMNRKLPLHIVEKKIPYLNEAAEHADAESTEVADGVATAAATPKDN